MYDVSTVVEIVKSKGDTTDMAVAPERSFATLVDRPVIVHPEKQRYQFHSTNAHHQINYHNFECTLC